MNYFNGVDNLKDAKKRYRELSMKYHPDIGGDVEIMTEVNNQYDRLLTGYLEFQFAEFEDSRGFRPKNFDKFSEILKKVIRLNCRVEIIGIWIYAFDSYSVKEELKSMGFFFSKKHRAWIYNGGRYRKVKSKLSTDDVRNIHGFEIIRDREESAKIAE